MELTRRDMLASRACRVVLRDRRYSRPRSRALIDWLKSDWEPTADIAGRALASLGPQAFDDLLNDVLSQAGPPRANLVWALELFPERHERLLPLLLLRTGEAAAWKAISRRTEHRQQRPRPGIPG